MTETIDFQTEDKFLGGENNQNTAETSKTYTFEDLRTMSKMLLKQETFGGNPQHILNESQELLQLADMCKFGSRIRQLEIQGSVPMLLVAISGDIEAFIQEGGIDIAKHDIRFGHIWHFTRQEKGQPGDHMEFDFDPNTTEGFEELAELSEGTIKKGLNEKWNFYLHN